jgi:hypothetical protein
MGRAGVLQEIRVMRFEDVFGRHRSGRLSCEEAAELLGMSVSTFFRWRRRYETRYFDLTAKHFHEKLAGHGIVRSYSWTKNTLQAAGKITKAKRRGAHRRRRPRKPMVALEAAGVATEALARPGLGHGIDEPGLSAAAAFLRRHLGGG